MPIQKVTPGPMSAWTPQFTKDGKRFTLHRDTGQVFSSVALGDEVDCGGPNYKFDASRNVFVGTDAANKITSKSAVPFGTFKGKF